MPPHEFSGSLLNQCSCCTSTALRYTAFFFCGHSPCWLAHLRVPQPVGVDEATAVLGVQQAQRVKAVAAQSSTVHGRGEISLPRHLHQSLAHALMRTTPCVAACYACSSHAVLLLLLLLPLHVMVERAAPPRQHSLAGVGAIQVGQRGLAGGVGVQRGVLTVNLHAGLQRRPAIISLEGRAEASHAVSPSWKSWRALRSSDVA